MEFGKISNVDKVDWTIPPDPLVSTEFLKSIRSSSPTQFFIGTPAWGHKEWVGKIYPPKTKATDFLYHYSRKYNCIELNTSHYRVPTVEQAKKWVSQVPKEFLFCPKVLQQISHTEEGLSNKELLDQWTEFLKSLGNNLGPCFIQFPPHFSYAQKKSLHGFLKNWPSEFPLALEFRHPSWFHKGEVLPALTQYLQAMNVGLVITDVAGRRDVVHTSLSADFTMLRFIGNNLHASDAPRAHEWAKRLGQWSEQGLKRVFFFVHEPNDLLAPEMTEVVVRELNKNACAGLAFSGEVALPNQKQLDLNDHLDNGF